MRRLLAAALALAALSALAAPAAGGEDRQAERPAVDATSSACKWQWKKKRVVKWVRKRNGGRKRIVRYRKVKVCVQIPPPAPSRLGVKAWEFGFTLSAKSILAGDTIVELNNRGEDAHDLHVQRSDGGPDLATPETVPGQVNRIRFVSAPGTYRLWCSLPNHATWGMDTTVTVTQGS